MMVPWDTNHAIDHIFDIRKHSPRQNESFFTKEFDFRAHYGSKSQNDKFVAIGDTDAETSANLILFTF